MPLTIDKKLRIWYNNYINYQNYSQYTQKEANVMAEQTITNSGYPVDGEIVVTVLSDYSAAFMTLYPPQNNGREITYEDAVAALMAKAVTYNVQTQLIKAAIESRVYEKEFKVAEADKAVDGIDGTITYKYSKDNVLAPKEDEHGFVDYKNLGLIQNIHTNDIIAEITLPTDGTDGTDIRGVTLKAVPGKRANFTIGPGTALSEDGLSIYAAIDGHVCFRNNTFCVDHTVTISGDVDASVGNIEFLGDIVIKGEVLEGFRVVSGKNVTVSGNVTGAEIRAGGNITIKKGSINSSLTAHGDINCQFCEYSNISTDGNIHAQSFVICDVYCGANLTSKALNGGKYTVLGDTEVTYLGTKTYAPTEVIAGDNAVLNKEKEGLKKKIPELDVKIDRCTQIVDFLTEKRKELKHLPEDKEELLGVTVKTKLNCQMELKQIRKRIAEIDSALRQKQYRTVICKGTAYPGTRVTINTESMKFETETTRVKIYLDNDGCITTGIV